MSGNKFGSLKSADPTDECYTSDWLVEDLLTPVLPYLRGKKVLSPCDSEWSAYVKFLGRYSKEYNYEYRYSSSDMFTNPDVEWCDIVITNPPFSKEVEFWEECLKPMGKDWVLMCMLASNNRVRNSSKSFRTYEPSEASFRTPTGIRKIGVTCFSSLDCLVENSFTSGSDPWEKIDIFELKEPCCSILYGIGVKEVFYSNRSLKQMEPMISGNYYVIPTTDIGHLPEGVTYVRGYYDELVLTVRGKGYQRILVKKS